MKRLVSVMSVIVLIAVSCAAFAETPEYPSFWVYEAKTVKAVQKALNANGAKLKVTGTFDLATAKAVKAFQKKAKLPVTGVVDATVATKLGIKNWKPGLTMYYMVNFADVKAAKGKYVVYVALGGRSLRPHLLIYRNGKLVAETSVIAGNQQKGHSSPLGIHTVSGTVKSRKTSTGNIRKDLVYLKVNGKATSYAISGFLYKPDGKKVAGQKLGAQFSNDGGIRVPDALAKWLRIHNGQIAKIVIDDRAMSPRSVGYKTLIKTK